MNTSNPNQAPSDEGGEQVRLQQLHERLWSAAVRNYGQPDEVHKTGHRSVETQDQHHVRLDALPTYGKPTITLGGRKVVTENGQFHIAGMTWGVDDRGQVVTTVKDDQTGEVSVHVTNQRRPYWGQDSRDVGKPDVDDPAMIAMAEGYVDYLLDVTERLVAGAE